MTKEFEQINVDSTTKRRIEHLSQITNISQSRIISDFINSMFAVGVTSLK